MHRVLQYATPSGPDVHHDVLLSTVAVSAFSDGSDEFIADQLFPSVGVGKQSDKYPVINKGAFLRIPNTARAPKTQAKRIEFDVSSDSYFADNYALAGENALEDLANADMAFQLRENTTRLVTLGLRRDQENRIASLVTSATNLGSGTILSGTSLWSDYVNSNPIADVRTGQAFIRQQTGLRANTMLIDEDTLEIARQHPLLLEMYKYSRGGTVSDEELMRVFRVQKLIVAAGIKENALEGGTSSVTNIWGNNVLLAHIEPAVSLQTMTLGLRFQWTPEGFPAPFSVGRKREEGAGSRWVEIVESQYFQDEKIIATDLGYLIANTL